ncbi:2'-5' RNA ligase superfamily protein [Treponema bryantii]|uniref:2'-5' RNA ligase superfamily protein n=1 Tax=Treponema bryantii TaxID=163 RepID=A0A1H9D6Y2_9SPIR|nr:2'-5' RNA ligase family protein [Treponema bryantii]SEQ09236.1 2'-5' RNA ligase superfamily protein [Treponema bryantii]
MFDSSLITYAVSLHFSQKVNEIVISTLHAIADETENRFMIEKKIPPHITIGAFHAAREEEAKLLQFVEEFSQGQKAGSVQFREVGNFNGKVLFLKPEKNLFLSEINKELHTLLLPEFEKAENGYYLPDIWFPHTTLATRLNQSQFSAAKEIAKKISLPLEAAIEELAVYQCSPFFELKKFGLSR